MPTALTAPTTATRAEDGCLVLADISGYTDYLLGTELEHAHDVLADLTDTVVSSLRPVFRLSKLEGDAAFMYALTTEIEASMLLDTVEGAYFAFRRRLRDVDRASSCECNACIRIPELGLKFVVHHGRFVRRDVDGREELTGGDVVLAHRLLKNGIVETLGLRAYAAFTDQVIASMDIDPAALGMRPHRERYDDVGEVKLCVEDLEVRWTEDLERTRIFVLPTESQFDVGVDLPVPPPIAWEWLTNPQKRARWQQGVVRVDQNAPRGRREPGTVNHCVHGKDVAVEEIVDWRPFRYYSLSYQFPVIGTWVWTVELIPRGDAATTVHWRGRRLSGAKAAVFWRAIGRSRVIGGLTSGGERLATLISAAAAPALDPVP